MTAAPKKKRMKNGDRRNRKRRCWMDQTPLFVQLLILMTLVTALLISFLLIRDYRRNRQSVMDQRIQTSSRLLNLELQNLDQYIRELASFCLQPYYDTEFKSSISSRTAIPLARQNYIKTQIRAYYYSRTDLNSYFMYFCHQGQTYGRDKAAQHVTLLPDSEFSREEGFFQCADSKYYNAIMPSSDPNSFFCYYQSIIQIKNRQPEAVVRLEVNTSYAENMNQEHLENEEFICVLNEGGKLLFSGLDTMDEETWQSVQGSFDTAADGQAVLIRIGGKNYLGVLCRSDRYGLQLVSFLSMEVIQRELSSLLRSGILFGLLVWLGAGCCMIFILRLATRPLTALSKQMKKVGNGNFTPSAEIGGSREIVNLTESFNDMVAHIERLIRLNYLAEINEKTSRLTALEAQINPHFLYNTLQAISTEALLNDQPQIHEMITSLASNLRYSIKGGDLVSLRAEMKYTRNYIMLQKMRLEDRLNVKIDLDDQAEQLLIPKISIQTLVENSIIHGMGPDSDSIFISIRAALSASGSGRLLEITVADDGCGIEPEQQKKMQQEFRDYLKPGTAGKIGLANLYSRLQLLYQGKAELVIRSDPGEGTSITMQIPVSEVTAEKEGEENV